MNAPAISTNSRQENWFKHYPPGIGQTIDRAKLSTIAEMLEATVRKFPSRTAFECMGAKITFQEFDDMATRMAGFLQNKFGLKKGDTIAIMLPNLLQFPI